METGIKRFTLYILVIIIFLGACVEERSKNINRPIEPWAFRSVLDERPRMLTLALDSSCYVAYDLANCTLHKAWKGGVLMEGAAYSDKKNVQPSSWGAAYFKDENQQSQWLVETDGEEILPKVISRGYSFLEDNEKINLSFLLITPTHDTLRVEERPEFMWIDSGKPGLERVFTTSGVPDNVKIKLRSLDTIINLNSNSTTRWIMNYNPLPAQSPPVLQEAFDHRGRYWMEKSDCFTCHEVDQPTVGPSFKQIAQRYYKQKEQVRPKLKSKIIDGGAGVWGSAAMNPHPKLSDVEVNTMLNYIFTLKPKEDQTYHLAAKTVNEKIPKEKEEHVKPGFGAALQGVHPSYELQTLHTADFKPRTGGLAFLPDGRLLVTTWDKVGGVYLLDNLDSENSVEIKLIATGLSEPLGIEVVDGEIFVLQKHELTQLIDNDGDEVIDEYRAICNSWGVTDDFHEFAFGLEYIDGYFYATLSMAMRLLADEEQKFDRGRTIKISKDGTYEWINYGLRTPNGIGLGPDNQLFVTDNQGQWVPANKLIHVKQGEYHGMAWGLPKSVKEHPPIAKPAIWLPQDEIANSPTEPVLIKDGPYAGQMLHGDVTHGGIKRDFLEMVNGEYQGAVFRFTQGLEAGVNRLCWGPDGALYIGQVGMVGGWSWKGKQYGLQRIKFNNTITFEMLAIRAKPNGFEIEFTEPLQKETDLKPSDFLIKQWWYQPTENYGGPKMDLSEVQVENIALSKDRKKVYLEIPDLKEEHVVYFQLSEDIRSSTGQTLWSSEAWYTLNNIPELQTVQ